MEQPQIELIVRLTARVSAVAFVAALALFAASSRQRHGGLRQPIRLFVAFIVGHTIHFGAVRWLAALSDGANIRDRGGWPVVAIVAMLFYLAAFTVLRAWLDRSSGLPGTRGQRVAAHAGVAFIALLFLNSYVARVERLPVYWLAVACMVAVVAMYFVRTFGTTAARARS